MIEIYNNQAELYSIHKLANGQTKIAKRVIHTWHRLAMTRSVRASWLVLRRSSFKKHLDLRYVTYDQTSNVTPHEKVCNDSLGNCMSIQKSRNQVESNSKHMTWKSRNTVTKVLVSRY
ncbi:hypothetical protein M758_1G174700 [Ceratodon purpureus]|nr:hypothetical protein M758_1G174700 [Ceratodon purpureus]